jgi:hypothetical protein
MTSELFQGTPALLKARIDAIIAMPKTINHVILLEKSWYLIIYS